MSCVTCFWSPWLYHMPVRVRDSWPWCCIGIRVHGILFCLWECHWTVFLNERLASDCQEDLLQRAFQCWRLVNNKVIATSAFCLWPHSTHYLQLFIQVRYSFLLPYYCQVARMNTPLAQLRLFSPSHQNCNHRSSRCCGLSCSLLN